LLTNDGVVCGGNDVCAGVLFGMVYCRRARTAAGGNAVAIERWSGCDSDSFSYQRARCRTPMVHKVSNMCVPGEKMYCKSYKSHPCRRKLRNACMATLTWRPYSSTLRNGNDGTVQEREMHRNAMVSARARRVVNRRNGIAVGADPIPQLILGPSAKDMDVYM